MSALIHQVIHSMNKSQKKYFKKSLTKKGKETGSQLVDLFDLLNKQDEYEEVYIKKQFSKKYKEQYFSKTKFRLKNNLLNFLCDSNYNTNQANSLGNIINKIDLGFKIGSPELVREWINKGYELSEQIETEVINYQMIIYEAKLQSFLDEDHEKLLQLVGNAIGKAETMRVNLEYKKLKIKAYQWHQKLKNDDFTQKARIEKQEIENNPYFKANLNDLNYYQTRELVECKMYLLDFDKEYQKAADLNIRVLELLEQKDLNKQFYQITYLQTFLNLIIIFIKVEDYDNAYKYIELYKLKISSLSFDTKKNEALYKNRILYTELPLSIETKSYNRIIDLQENILEGFLKGDERDISFRQLSLNQLVESHFALHNYEKCMDLSIEYSHKIKLKDYYLYLKVYEFASAYVLGLEKKMDSILNAYKYTLNKYEEKPEDFYQLFLFLKNISNGSVNQEQSKSIQVLFEKGNAIRLVSFFNWVQDNLIKK